MHFTEFYANLEKLAPPELSAVWDNDGVMCKNTKTEVSRVLVALDATKSVLEYAKENGFDTVLTHHPLIFKGIKSMSGDDVTSGRVMKALLSDISVISLHTRLDAAEGGVNDTLAEMFELSEIEAFGDAEAASLGRIGKLSSETDVFDFAEKVKIALGCEAVRVTGKGKVSRVAVVGGDGKDFIIPAVKAGADVLVTGDSGYNASEEAAEMGFTVIEAGHYHTEVPVCEKLVSFVRKLGLEAEVYVSCPYKIV